MRDELFDGKGIMNRLKCYVICLCCICALLVLAAASAKEEYVIGPEDVLEISVYDHEEMTSTVRVGGNGVITLPLLDAVEVGGLTVSQATKKITDLLSGDYIVDPKVNIFVVTFRGQKVVILGQVENPGLYEIRAETTLLELISLAGGLNPDAGDIATLKRVNEKGTEERKIDLERLIDKGDTTLNFRVMDGDKVFIEKAGLFYVTGEVNRPSSYPYQDRLSLIKAITMAGGLTNIASSTKVKILRQNEGKEQVIEQASMDTEILPEDVIVVPKRGWFSESY
jgi:polysaccharide export outer membrane protein